MIRALRKKTILWLYIYIKRNCDEKQITLYELHFSVIHISKLSYISQNFLNFLKNKQKIPFYIRL